MELEILTALLGGAIGGGSIGAALFFLTRRPTPVAPPESEAPSAPGVCKKPGDHRWPKREQLVSDDERVFWCLNNCGSSLRHKASKEVILGG